MGFRIIFMTWYSNLIAIDQYTLYSSRYIDLANSGLDLRVNESPNLLNRTGVDVRAKATIDMMPIG